MFTTACPKCLTRCDVPVDAAGKRTTCPKCRQRFTVPGTSTRPAYMPGVSSATLPNPFAAADDAPDILDPRRSWVARRWPVVAAILTVAGLAAVGAGLGVAWVVLPVLIDRP